MKYRSSAFYEGALVKAGINGQDRCARVTRRSRLPKEAPVAARRRRVETTYADKKQKYSYGRSFYSFTMGSNVNRRTPAKLYAHIGMIYRMARAAPISDTFSLFSSPPPPLLPLVRSVLFVRKMWKKSEPIRVTHSGKGKRGEGEGEGSRDEAKNAPIAR